MTGRKNHEAELFHQAGDINSVVNALSDWITSQHLSVFQVIGALTIVLGRTLNQMPKEVRDEMREFTMRFFFQVIGGKHE